MQREGAEVWSLMRQSVIYTVIKPFPRAPNPGGRRAGLFPVYREHTVTKDTKLGPREPGKALLTSPPPSLHRDHDSVPKF